MKRNTYSFTGTRPIFTGSPSVAVGGFNLDTAKQNFAVGSVVPAGTLGIADEEKRTVQVIKTAKVVSIADDTKVVTLLVDEFYAPCFAVGDKVLKSGAISGLFSAASQITKIEHKNSSYVITLDKQISGLAPGDVVEEVVDSSSNAAARGTANCVLIRDVEVGEYENDTDVSFDTMQYALYENRVPAIPAAQKDATGLYLKGNAHVKLTKSN